MSIIILVHICYCSELIVHLNAGITVKCLLSDVWYLTFFNLFFPGVKLGINHLTWRGIWFFVLIWNNFFKQLDTFFSPVLNFVTYNFMYVFCLQLFPVFCRIHVYNSLIIRCRKRIIQQLGTSLFRLSDQLQTSFFYSYRHHPVFLTADCFI